MTKRSRDWSDDPALFDKLELQAIPKRERGRADAAALTAY